MRAGVWGRAPVRREALICRVEVEDLHRWPVVAGRGGCGQPGRGGGGGGGGGGRVAEDRPSREVPGRVGAVLTTPGRVSTVRWVGPGKRGGEVYARNR